MRLGGKLRAGLAVFGVLTLAGCSQNLDGVSEGLSATGAHSAAPVKTAGKSAVAYRATEKDRECLARAMFFESNRSSRDGLVAVGSVVMNRLDSRSWGDDICGVVGAKRQFAPGVLSRPMNSQAMPDVMAAADAVLKGERHPEVKPNVMFFHTAGLKFPYKNMHYTTVAGGNAFYEKRSRLPKRDNPLPVEAPVMVAANETPPALAAATPEQSIASQPTSDTMLVADNATAQTGEVVLAMNITAVPSPRPTAPDQLPGVTGLPDEEPLSDRFAGTGTMTAQMNSTFDTTNGPVAAYDANPEKASAIGAMLLSQRAQ